MAIVVEDGTGLTNSNSYVSVADATVYATLRGVTVTANLDDALIKAIDYIESQSFQGYKNTKAQALQWPRTGVYIDNFSVDVDEIPTELINAQIEAALVVDGGDEILPVNERETETETVDVISVTYAPGSRSNPGYPKIDVWLDKVLISKQGSTVRV